MLQVTLYTSLKLRGRTAELPRSDFNRQVIRFTRHTLLLCTSELISELMITEGNKQKAEPFPALLFAL
jgi:hypothetical protein